MSAVEQFRDALVANAMESHPTMDRKKAVEAANAIVKMMVQTEGKPLLSTPQFDARFPNQNQTKFCWQNYVDFHKCVKARGDDFPMCQTYFKNYRSMCPNEWVERWNSEIAEGRFPHDI